ncbi:MAG: response regulator [Chthoniobacterales bacterium]
MPINILAVEDDPHVARVVQLALGNHDCRVTVAMSAKEAAAAIAERPREFDVVLTDHNMPGISGGQFVRHLADRNFEGRVVVLSAYVAPQQEEEYRRLGVSAMIPKPFDISELRRAVGL